MPPVPVERQFRPRRVLLQLLDRRNDVLDESAVPDPQVDVGERIRLRTVDRPALAQGPRTVDLRGVVPAATVELHTGRIGDATRGDGPVVHSRHGIDARHGDDVVGGDARADRLDVPVRIAVVEVEALGRRTQNRAELHRTHETRDVIAAGRQLAGIEREPEIGPTPEELRVRLERHAHRRELDFAHGLLAGIAREADARLEAAFVARLPFRDDREVRTGRRMPFPGVRHASAVRRDDARVRLHLLGRYARLAVRTDDQPRRLQRIDLRHDGLLPRQRTQCHQSGKQQHHSLHLRNLFLFCRSHVIQRKNAPRNRQRSLSSENGEEGLDLCIKLFPAITL